MEAARDEVAGKRWGRRARCVVRLSQCEPVWRLPCQPPSCRIGGRHPNERFLLEPFQALIASSRRSAKLRLSWGS